QFKSPIIIILLVAVTISAFLKDFADSAIILVIVVSSALLSFLQEYNANNAAEKLRAQVTLKTRLLRDGKEISIPSEEIVPGDVVLLSAGSLIPADGIVLEARDFFVNQAVLTGETFPVEKRPGQVSAGRGLAERTNTVFMGTNVRSGSARAVIVQTGPRTTFGQIARRLTLRPPETEFERGIRRLGYLLSEVMFVLVLTIFAFNVLLQKPILDSLLFSIALAVGLTPQLLPAIININLSRGSQSMAKHGVIVRRLASIENFGSMDVLCTDKTGTLTEGVVRLDAALDIREQPSELVLRCAYWNARFQTGLPNPLDEAIISAAGREIQTQDGGAQKVDEIPYDFIRKRLSVVVHVGQEDRLLWITKGALENVLQICTHIQQSDASVVLNATTLSQINQLYQNWSGQGYRVLGVAMKNLSLPAEGLGVQTFSREQESGLTFLGFLLFFDHPKSGVRETITELERLGVQLKIITGDNMLVAAHTA
ncbi:MAG: cation-translocating P-type ATPase, partial [Omnitrophica WOR_2 bacterium]